MVGLLNKPWWSLKDDIYKGVIEQVNIINNNQRSQQTSMLRHLRMYAQRDYSATMEDIYRPAAADESIRMNATKSAIDTVTARICMHDTRLMFLTSGGKWEMRNKARKLQRFVDGLFYEADVYHQAMRAFKDAAITGTGFINPYIDWDKKKICVERVFPGEVRVDEVAGATATPRSYFRLRPIPVEVILAKYPDAEKAVESARVYHNVNSRGNLTSNVMVYEACHLPSGDDADDGVWALCTEAGMIKQAPWPYEWPFIIPFRWNELPIGYMGSGAVEDTHGLQRELNHLLEKIQKSMKLCSTAYLMKHISSDVPNSHFTNEDGTIIEWSGSFPPDIRVFPAQHGQVFEHTWNIRKSIYEEIGTSQLSATSAKPPGIESGIALQTIKDNESERFAMLHKSWDRFFLQIGKCCVALAKELYTSEGKYGVKWNSRRYVETIDWSEVDIGEDDYVLRVWPSNLLPQTPAGRIDRVERLMQAGLIDPKQGMSLLDFPDVEAYQSLETANLESILWLVDQVVYEGNYIAPRSYHDLTLGMKYFQMAALRAEVEGAPQEVMQRCVKWIDAANKLLKRTQPTPQPAPIMGMPGMEMAPPQPGTAPPAGMEMPPPQSGVAPPGMGAEIPPEILAQIQGQGVA